MIKKIKNQKSKIKKIECGFTLIELLVSIVVLIAIGSVVTNVITSSLRGSNKTNNLENIRQNGNYALNQMSKNIQYAQTFDGLSDNGVDYVADCPTSTPVPPALPLPETTFYSYIKVTPLNSAPIEYSCIASTPTFKANGVNIFDTSVSLKNCSISCTKTYATDVPIIGISFELTKSGSNNGFAENSGSVKFETSITMRNYRK